MQHLALLLDSAFKQSVRVRPGTFAQILLAKRCVAQSHSGMRFGAASSSSGHRRLEICRQIYQHRLSTAKSDGCAKPSLSEFLESRTFSAALSNHRLLRHTFE